MNEDRIEYRPFLAIESAARITFASAQNAVPIIRSIRIENPTDEPLIGLTLNLRPQPAFCREKKWTIDRVGAGDNVSLSDKDLTLDFTFLAGLNEAERGQLTFVLEGHDETIVEQIVPIELLARDEWGGLGEMAQILAAFVSPNDSAVARILKDASKILEVAGHRSSLEGYQSDDPARAYMLSAAIWSAVTGLALTYAEPPRSFELIGQKVRDPGRITGEGLATCLDISLLIAAALEAAGLNPAVIFKGGHAFAGVWLKDMTFSTVVESDVVELRKAIAAREFIAFETTLVTSRPPAGFDHAVENGRAQLSEAHEVDFERAIDISRARAAGIRPLASHRVATAEGDDPVSVAPAALPGIPDFGLLPGEQAEDTPTSAQGRIERWQRKLLDLSLRNRLLNFSETKQTIPFVCPDVSGLEDRLAEGGRLRIVSLVDENPIGDRDPELFRQQTGQDIHAAFAAEALERGQVCVPLPGRDMAARLTTLFRKAKSDLSEGGTNTLFLGAGFLRWKKTAGDTRSYRAPLLLLPIKLNRRSAQSDFFLTHHEDEVRINSTLLQFLERDFGLRIPALQGELPTDHAGIDLPLIFETMRLAVRDVQGFEVVEDMALSTFSFAKYLMWKDLVDRTDSLRNNRLVRHLIDSPETPFDQGDGRILHPSEIDRRIAPVDLLTPLPADSSQLSAVVAAADGLDFVVIGPPGTGKSQTIANMIAHCLAQGRSVLFVAEKSAALDVVYRRLKACGLGDVCLELHSNKTDRRSVISQLGGAWDRAFEQSQQEWVRVTSELEIHRDKLNGYVDALHAPGSHGFSVFDAIGIVVDGAAPFDLTFASPDAHDAESFAGLRSLAERAGRTFSVVRDCQALGSIAHADWSFAWQSELLTRAEALTHATQALAGPSTELERTIGLAPEPEFSADRLGLLSRFATASGKTAAGDFSAAFDEGFDDFTVALVDLEKAIASVRAERSRLSARYADSEIARMPLDELDRDWRVACTKFWPLSAFARSRVRKLLQTYTEAGRADPGSDIAPLRILQSNLASVSHSPLSALPVFGGVDTDAERLKSYLADAGDLRDAVAEVGRIATNTATLGATLASLLQVGGDQQPAAKTARAFSDVKAAYDQALSDYVAHAGGSPQAETLSALQRQLSGLVAEKARIVDWTKWVDVRAGAVGRGLEPLILALEADRVEDASEAEEAFCVAYFTWWLPLAMDANPELRGFLHWDHADRISKFRALDAAAQGLAAAQVRRAVMHDLPARDGVARKSELGTLRHQLGLQRPSISIRQLIGQMPQTFTKLSPCVLMSPLSIAQYLPVDHASFDMVIFDEASQITTWDAVGAIARGSQSIIVGDPKQLPPTNFFGRTNEDDDDLETYEKDLPSILDEAAAAGLPTHQLNWHYRSRDEALIAFSNYHYYGDRLVTFPSPKTQSDALVFHKIDGVYARGSGRTNEAEARAIVALAVRRLKEWLRLPEVERLTLGVITFNAQQQELILDLFDAARREAPELEWFFEDDREEPVIVKNLENIQGDERDVMLFSVTFGPDKAGKIAMNFGAVNSDGGEKRLNVAVTRARAELHVFASITAEQIDLSRTKALGVAHLKNYLDYAARGAVALPAMDKGSLGPAESPFEEAVAEALRARGWEVRTQIGVSGFRIDLAIIHPDRAGAYLAGVECDGATYHSSASARDRDQIREAVLRNLGWEILRIWSTDWFMNADEVCDRTDADLQELLDASRRAEAERAAASAAARKSDDVPGEHEDAVASLPTASGEDEDEEAPQGSLPTVDDLVQATGNAPTAPNFQDEATQIVEEPGFGLPVAAHTGGIEPEASPETPVASPDAERFFDPTYTATLCAIISDIVKREGPIRDHMLARAISRTHGWQRAGRRIRERMEACLGQNEAHDEDGAIFIWAPGAYAQSIPFRAGIDRSPRDISLSEVLGLISEHTNLAASEDAARDLARLMGIGRLSEDARAYLKSCLLKAEVVSG